NTIYSINSPDNMFFVDAVLADKSTSKTKKIFEISFSLIFIISVIYLIIHHVEEAKKPLYESLFTTNLLSFLHRRSPNTIDKDSRIKTSLEVFYKTFKNFGCLHASIYTAEGDSLIIKSNHVFPEEKNPSYFQILKFGQGVAGRVFEDTKPRYVPRLF